MHPAVHSPKVAQTVQLLMPYYAAKIHRIGNSSAQLSGSIGAKHGLHLYLHTAKMLIE
jgi:hypothetical protein